MADNTLNNSSPDISVNHTNTKENEKNKKIFISIILVILILSVILCIAYNLFFKKDKFAVSKEAFILSDKSTLLFLDNENYILSYKIMNQDIKMKGKYKITYDENISEDIKLEYQSYIQEFRKEDYVLSFLELQNEELYVDNNMIENGYINTHYILMAYFEEGKLEFLGYNIDNGIKIKFEKQEGKFKEYLEEIDKNS